MRIKLLSLAVAALSVVSCTNSTEESILSEKDFTSFTTKQTQTANGSTSNNLLVGSTLYHRQLNTPIQDLYLQDNFKYLTPANAAKQSVVYRDNSSQFNWTQITDLIKFARENSIDVRVHGPISPQCSPWAKEDNRTAKELEDNMTEFMKKSAIRYNKIKTVKWMDVVNETVNTDGTWFKNKPGVDKWENPWYKIGQDETGVPLYILKAFEIATEHAPNVKLVYNQHGGLQPKMWNKVKNTILYLRSKGYRVDGIGWQGHLSRKNPATNEVINKPKLSATRLANLIDWAHENNLEFHVTELDYGQDDSETLARNHTRQANAYQNIIDVLKEKSKNGVVTLNLWDMSTRVSVGNSDVLSIYDKNLNPNKAYNVVKEAMDASTFQ